MDALHASEAFRYLCGDDLRLVREIFDSEWNVLFEAVCKGKEFADRRGRSCAGPERNAPRIGR
jgi:hypothetical protein